MPTHSNKYSDAPQIVQKIPKEAGEKKSPQTRGGEQRWKNQSLTT
jgi:hypothetical protein